MRQRSARGRLAATAVLCAAGLAVALPSAAAAAPVPYTYGENDAGGFRNVLPPGEGTDVNAVDAASFLATGMHPSHDQDQLSLYTGIYYAVHGLTAQNLPDFYKDASFGVPENERERTYSPRPDVTIVRDEYGVPHIYGQDRAGAMFGAGYAVAEDRLFFIDVLRHAGRGDLSSFAGGANTGMDEEVWSDTPYNEGDLQQQFDLRRQRLRQARKQLQDDTLEYVAGINQYINEARTDPAKMPVEYAAVGQPLGPDPFRPTDVISIASLVAGIFGKGGGNELGSATVLENAQARFGQARRAAGVVRLPLGGGPRGADDRHRPALPLRDCCRSTRPASRCPTRGRCSASRPSSRRAARPRTPRRPRARSAACPVRSRGARPRLERAPRVGARIPERARRSR